MIGNVVQEEFLVQSNYPTAAALSFILMAIITVGVLVYAKVLGTEELDVKAELAARSTPPAVGAAALVGDGRARLGGARAGLPVRCRSSFIVVFSFNKPKSRFNYECGSGSPLDTWLHPFAKQELTDALWVSLRVAVIATIAATILGTLDRPGPRRATGSGAARSVNLLLVLPLTTPEIVLRLLAVHAVLRPRGDRRGFWTIVIAHVMFCVSFVALTVKARLRGFDWTLEQAAMDLGAARGARSARSRCR